MASAPVFRFTILPAGQIAVRVNLINTNAGGFYVGSRLPNRNKKKCVIGSKAILNHKWLYCQPTNSVCCPLELQDAVGTKLEPFKRGELNPDAFPDSFSVSEATNNEPQLRTPFPSPLTFSLGSIGSVALNDYFNITNTGDYPLTVWPKIYHRSSTNDDVCRRIDLAPVMVRLRLCALASATTNWSDSGCGCRVGIGLADTTLSAGADFVLQCWIMNASTSPIFPRLWRGERRWNQFLCCSAPTVRAGAMRITPDAVKEISTPDQISRKTEPQQNNVELHWIDFIFE